jgi:hypothetical protein
MKRSLSPRKITSHPSTLAVFSGLLGALIGANLQDIDLTATTLTWVILDEAGVRAAKLSDEQLQTVTSAKNVKRAF